MAYAVPVAMTDGGLRERKKRETRDAISRTATELFARQGFEQTTIAEVAREAGVAKMTVTNYFALKEDLVFDLRAEIVDRLAAAVRTRETTPPASPCSMRSERRLTAAWMTVTRHSASSVRASPRWFAPAPRWSPPSDRC